MIPNVAGSRCALDAGIGDASPRQGRFYSGCHRKGKGQDLVAAYREIGKRLRLHCIARPAEDFRRNNRTRQPVRQFAHHCPVTRATSAHDGAKRTCPQMCERARNACRCEGGESRRGILCRQHFDNCAQKIVPVERFWRLAPTSLDVRSNRQAKKRPRRHGAATPCPVRCRGNIR